MKKILTIVAFILVLALFGCAKKEDRVQKYVEKNQEIEEICSNVYCSSEFTAKGNSVVLTITANNIDDAGEESKLFYDNMMSEIDAKVLFEKMKKEESAIKSLIIEFCESDGDIIASYEYK